MAFHCYALFSIRSFSYRNILLNTLIDWLRFLLLWWVSRNLYDVYTRRTMTANLVRSPTIPVSIVHRSETDSWIFFCSVKWRLSLLFVDCFWCCLCSVLYRWINYSFISTVTNVNTVARMYSFLKDLLKYGMCLRVILLSLHLVDSQWKVNVHCAATEAKKWKSSHWLSLLTSCCGRNNEDALDCTQGRKAWDSSVTQCCLYSVWICIILWTTWC